MENVQEYGLSFEFDNKIYKQLDKFEKKLKQFESRRLKADKADADLKKKYAKTDMDTTQAAFKKEEATARKAANTKQKLLLKEQQAKEKLLQKEKIQQVKFTSWKNKQFRTAAFERLSVDQKMQLKYVLNSKKSEQEVREEYAKTTAFIRTQNRQRTVYERKQNTKKRTNSKGGGSGGMFLMGNPAVMGAAIVAAVTVGIGKKGNADYTQLKQGAEGSGVEIKALQREAFLNQSLLGNEFGIDKISQVYTDQQDKIGELQRDLKFGKDGRISGGGAAATDVAQYLVDKKVIAGTLKDVKDYFKGDAVKFQKKLFKDLERTGATKSEVAFITESLASDLSRIFKAQQNTARVSQANKNFDDLNIGLTDKQIARLETTSQAFSVLGASLSSSALKGWDSFVGVVGDKETLLNLAALGKGIAVLSGWLGKMLGWVVKVSLAISPLAYIMRNWADEITYAFNKVGEAFNYVTDIAQDVYTGVGSFKDKIVNAFKDIMNGIIDAIISVTPNFLLPDDMKTIEQVTPTERIRRTQAGDKILNPQRVVAPNSILGGSFGNVITPPAPNNLTTTNTNNISKVDISGESVSHIVINLDGEKISETVSKSPITKSAIQYEIKNNL